MAKPRLLFLVTEDWYFVSHRLPLAMAAREAGFEVTVVTRVREHGDAIRAAGLKLIPFEWSRRGMNPLHEFLVLIRLILLYRREKPDLVHQVALKPVLYGSFAARMTGGLCVVNAIAGMGFVFSSGALLARLLRPLIVRAFHLLLGGRNRLLILQNPDDLKQLVGAGVIATDQVRLIRGSGVDPQRFAPSAEPAGVPLVVLASRMLWDKGIAEFVDAARHLRKADVVARFVLVGDTDADNPAAVPPAQLAAWRDEGVVEWWGRRDDMPAVFAMANLVCLPSYYREGLPKVLLEAAACGRAIVTTDMPGCREIVANGDNGLLVPVRDAVALAAALGGLLADPARRQRMGQRGRERVLAEFSEAKVVAETLAIYRELLAAKKL